MHRSIHSLSPDYPIKRARYRSCPYCWAGVCGQCKWESDAFRHASQQFLAAVYVHCRNHAFNLAIVHSTKVRDVRNCLHGPRNSELHHSLTEAPKGLYDNRNKKRLQKFYGTRWTQHDSCIGLSGSVAAWHARQFHRLIGCLCITEGVESPVCLGAGFLGSQEKAGLHTETRRLHDLHTPECFFFL